MRTFLTVAMYVGLALIVASVALLVWPVEGCGSMIFRSATSTTATCSTAIHGMHIAFTALSFVGIYLAGAGWILTRYNFYELPARDDVPGAQA